MSEQLPSSAASPLSLADLDGEGPDRGSPELVDEEIVAAFDSLWQAELVRGRLEASGIAARLLGAHTVGLASHLAPVIGGVKVVVATKDAGEARAVMLTPALLDDDATPTRPEPQVDDVARWALRLSVLGIFLPVIGQIGSFSFVLQAFSRRRALSGRARVQLAVAIAVDVGVLVALVASLA